MILIFRQTSNVSKKSLTTDDREQCPICLLHVADLPTRTSLTKHLASHLERFSLDCLPLDTGSWGDQNIRDGGSDSSDPDQDLFLEPHEQLVSDEQEVERGSFEDLSTEDSRAEENEWSEENMRDMMSELAYQKDRESRQRMTAEEVELRIMEREREFQRIEATTRQLLEEHTHRSHEARKGDKADEFPPESYPVDLEDDPRNDIDAERKRIMEDWGRRERVHRERELKEQEDQAVAESVRRREEELTKNASERADGAQDNLDDVLRERLAEADFTQSQIDAIMAKNGKIKQRYFLRTSTTAQQAGGSTNPPAPVYPKVHTDHMAIETLRYYDIAWEYDKVSKKDHIPMLEFGSNVRCATVRSILHRHPPRDG